MSNEAVIVSTARTPIATSFRGALVDVDAFELATKAVAEAVARAGIDPELVDDVILGETLQGGGDIARYAAIEAGLVNAPGVAQNRHCASSLNAVASAAASIIAGMDRVVVAGGAHSQSTAPRALRRAPGTDDWADWMSPSHVETPDAPTMDMSITVGWNAAQSAGLSREDLDAWAYRSHQRAAAGADRGAFGAELFPIDVVRSDGTKFMFAVDEHPRRDTSLERLAGLKVLHPEIPGFSITAGNAAGINDAAAAVVMTDRAFAEQQGLAPLAIIKAWASVGVPPRDTGMAPIEVIPKLLERAGKTVDDVDLWEINEAFASVPVAACKQLGLDEEIVNVLGSGCSLGHPIAATGARMVMTTIHELRRRGGGIGVAAMCAGGGMASAVLFEVPRP
jgi:acetyl-CoA acetyltransferase family protein